MATSALLLHTFHPARHPTTAMHISKASSSLLLLSRFSQAWLTPSPSRSISTTKCNISKSIASHAPTNALQNNNRFQSVLKASISSLPPLSSPYEEYIPLARDAMDFIDSSPDPFHCVDTSVKQLESAGFEKWSDSVLIPGGKYYFTRNKSTLVAFAIGKNYKPGNGFKIIGSHTDSPNLKVKPYSKRTTDKNGGLSGAIQIGVECYGGGLWHTWFDR